MSDESSYVEATCVYCGRPVVWVVTEAGKRMPLDPEPTSGGRWLVEEADGEDVPRARMLSREEAADHPTWLHRTHFTRCKPRPVQQELLA